jgi:transposase
MRLAHLGKKQSPDVIERRIAPLRGLKRSHAAIELTRAWNLGRKRSPETCAKLKARKLPADFGAKVSTAHPKVRAWLARHPRWTFHFTPTSASWLNAVEGFFSTLSRRRLKRGAFCSVVDLQAAINHYIREHNGKPRPFVWTKSAEAILAKLGRLPVPSE